MIICVLIVIGGRDRSCGVTVTAGLPYSERYGQVTPAAGRSLLWFFELCRGFAITWRACSSLHCPKFCLLLYPERWRLTSSVKSASIRIQDSYKPQNATLTILPISNSRFAVRILCGWKLRPSCEMRRLAPERFRTRLTSGWASGTVDHTSWPCQCLWPTEWSFCLNTTIANTVGVLESVCRIQLYVKGHIILIP